MDVRLVEIQLAEAGSPGLPAHGRFVDLGPGEAAAVDALAPGVVASAWGRWRAPRAAGGAIGLEFRSRDRGWVPLGLRDGRLDLDRPSDFLVEGEDLWMATEAGVLRTPERDGDLRRADLYATLAGPADLMRPPAGAGVWARVRSDPARASRLTHGAARPAPVAGDPFVQRLAVASGAWRFWLRESRAMGSGGRLHLVAENLHCEWIDPDNGPLPCDPEGGRFPFDDVTDLRGAHGGLLVASRAGVAAWAPGTRLAWADAAVWPIPGGASALQPVKGPIAPEILAVGPDGDGRATLWRMSTEPGGARFRPLGPWRSTWLPVSAAGQWAWERAGMAFRALARGGGPERRVDRGRFADDTVLDVANSPDGGPPYRLTADGLRRGDRWWPAPAGAFEVVATPREIVFLGAQGIWTRPPPAGPGVGQDRWTPLPAGHVGERLDPAREGGARVTTRDDAGHRSFWAWPGDGPPWRAMEGEARAGTRAWVDSPDGVWMVGPRGLLRADPASAARRADPSR